MSPRLEDVAQQALECEERYLDKKAFYKTTTRALVAVVGLIAGSVGILITCNSQSVAMMTRNAQSCETLRVDQDKTTVRMEHFNDIAGRQAVLLEALRVSTAEMARKIDRMDNKIDNTRVVTDAILTEVKRP